MVYRKRGISGPELLSYIKSRCIINEMDCWVWGGSKTDRGYGNMRHQGHIRRVHIVTYELVNGTVPEGQELDHRCRKILCCNPEHLEPVTHKENVRRGNLKFVSKIVQGEKTHCPRGHPYAGENLRINRKGSRICKACDREKHAERWKNA